jgi:hypothetical protein
MTTETYNYSLLVIMPRAAGTRTLKPPATWTPEAAGLSSRLICLLQSGLTAGVPARADQLGSAQLVERTPRVHASCDALIRETPQRSAA